MKTAFPIHENDNVYIKTPNRINVNDMTRDEVFNRIASQVGRQPVSCNCRECKQMCQRTPCLGTPQDILALINAGYIDQLCYTVWAAGLVLGHITQPIEMVQLKSKGKNKDGECVFFNDGKCDLHDSGLKPTEGKLSHHEVSTKELLKENNLAYQVAIEWCKEENYDVILEIVEKVMDHKYNKK